MARFLKSSLPHLRYYYTSTATAYSHPLPFSPARLRNIWISGLLDPSKVTATLREMLYSGDVDMMEDARKDIMNALPAFDGAVLVLSSVDGVQSQSVNVDNQMIKYQLPRLVFINNLDQEGANPWGVVNQARSKLHYHCAAIQVPIGLEYNFKGLVDLVRLKAYFFHGPNGKKVFVEEVPAYMEALVSEKRRELIKTVSEVDDKLAEAFCSDKPISAADLKEAVRRATIEQKFIPLFMGSAFKYKHTLVALAFTLKRKYDAITYLRIYEGVIRRGEFITNVNTGKTFKVPNFFEVVQKDKMGVPYSIEAYEDENGVSYTTEPRKDDLGAPHLVLVRNDEMFGVAHAGEIIAVHDVIEAPGDTFTDGLVRYTKASVDVSELVSRDFGVQVSKV